MWKRPSLCLAVAFAALVGLQWFPATGIYLMFLGAPIWTGWLFLALLAAIFFEAVIGRLPRILIVLPITIVGSYYAAILAQRSHVAALVEETATRNAEPLAVNALADRDLLFDLRGALMNDRFAVGALMSKYEISTAHISTLGARSGDFMDRLDVAEQCLPPATPLNMPDLGLPTVSACVTEKLPLQAGKVIVGRGSETEPFWGTELVTTTYTLTADGSPLGSAGALQVSLWPYLPQLLIGCGLVSGGQNQGWRCGAAPYPTESFVWPAELRKAGSFGERDLTPIAEKLGLALRSQPAGSGSL